MGSLLIPAVVVGESVAILLLCKVGGRLVIALPQGAWNRQTSRRTLPPGILVKPVAVDLLFGDRIADTPAEPPLGIGY